MGSAAGPASGFGAGDLQFQERPGDVERAVGDVLFLERQEFPAQLAGDVAEPSAHFNDDFRFRSEPAEAPQLLHEEAAVGQAVQRLVRFAEQVRDGRFDQIEMSVVLRAVFQFVHVKVLEMFFALKAFLSGPALADLLEEHIPFRFVAMAAGGFRPVVAEWIGGKRPSL